MCWALELSIVVVGSVKGIRMIDGLGDADEVDCSKVCDYSKGVRSREATTFDGVVTKERETRRTIGVQKAWKEVWDGTEEEIKELWNGNMVS